MFRKINNRPIGGIQFFRDEEELVIGDDSNIETSVHVDLNKFPNDYQWGIDPEELWRDGNVQLMDLVNIKKPIFVKSSFQGFGIDIFTILWTVQPSVIADYDDLRQYVTKIQKGGHLSQDQILRLYIIQHMYREKPIVHGLYIYRRFRFMDILHWYTAKEARIKLDLLGRLTWPDKFISPTTELGVICLKMDEDSRKYFAAFYIHSLAMVTGIASMIDFTPFETTAATTDELRLDLSNFERALDEYCSDRWNSVEMGDQTQCPNDIFFGFLRLVNEVMKLLADEIVNDVQQETGGDLNFKTRRVRLPQLKERLDICTIIMIEEFFKYFMPRYTARMSVDCSLQRVLPRANNVYITMTDRMSIPRREQYSEFPEQRLRTMFARSLLGELTLGEQVEFTPLTLQPVVILNFAPQREGQTLNFTSHTFLNRCRWTEGQRRSTITVKDSGRTGVREDFPIQLFRQGVPIGEDQVNGTEDEINSFLETGSAVPSPWKDILGPFNGFTSLMHSLFSSQMNDELEAHNEKKKKAQQTTGNSNPRIAAVPTPTPAGSSSQHASAAGSSSQHASTQQAANQAQPQQQPDDAPPAFPSFESNIAATPYEPVEWENESDRGSHRETRELVNYAEQIEDYRNDLEDSDNEYEVYPEEDRIRDTNYNVVDNGDTFERFYAEILSWLINPADTHKDEHINGHPTDNGKWILNYFRRDGRFFLRNLTHAQNVNAYKNHLRAFTMLGVRATVVDKMQENRFRVMKAARDNFLNDLYDGEADVPFAEMEIEGCQASKNLIHGVATSDDAQQNRELFDDCLRGLTLCVAYVERHQRHRRCPIPPNSPITRTDEDTSAFVFMLIRRMQIRNFTEQEILERDPSDTAIEHINVRFSLNRDVMKKQGFVLQAGQTLRFFPVCSLASDLRVAKAIERIHQLPESFLNRLFGPRCVPITYTPHEVRSPPSNSDLTMQMTDTPLPTTPNQVRQALRNQCDPGSLRYLIRCLHRNDCRMDRTHFNAIVQSVRTIGAGHPGSSGMSMVQGPPGTGKTNNLIFLLGAIIHHSQYGHMVPHANRVRFPQTPRNDNIHRRSNSDTAFRVLVVASSNVAVDNILLRVHREGIQDGNGGVIRPQMLRIARHDYEPLDPEVNQYLVRNASRLYDADHRERNNASLRAKRNRASECILYFSTSSAVGSAQFKELDQHIDIVCHDESAQSLESETMIPLTATNTIEGQRRLYYLGYGDEEQLPALTLVPNMLYSSKTLRHAPFHTNNIKMSLFQRLIYNNRVTVSFLSAQFRMHPAISQVTSVPYYACYFACPLGIEPFLTPFNQPALNANAFHPMTFIDTSALSTRFERDAGDGQISNQTESNLVVQIIQRLYTLVPEDTLDGQIAVIAPYRSQVQNLSTTLQQNLPGHNHLQNRMRRNITVCTVDSMQGSQRDVVIFTTTRSNRQGRVGFVREPQRLNVSVSRARKLNIIIADHGTIDKRGRQGTIFGIESFTDIYECCATGRFEGARLARATLNRNYVQGNNGQPQYEIAYRPVRSLHSTRSRTNNNSGPNNQGPFAAPPAPQAPNQEMQFIPSFDFSGLYPDANSPL